MVTFRAWLLLLLAIFTEVVGTISLHQLLDKGLLGYLSMGFFITLSYLFLGFAIKKIPLSVAYATWEALGLILITLYGVFIFGEILSLYQQIGVCLGVIGIILINLGD